MKKIITGFLVCIVGFTVTCTHGAVNNQTLEEDIERAEALELNFSTGKAAMVEILGSESLFEQLQDSKLIRPSYERTDEGLVERPPGRIAYDTNRGRRTPWVNVVMQGEVVSMSATEREITIAAEEETISLYVVEYALIERVFREGNVEIGLEDIEVGEMLSFVSVCLNADNPPQARSIKVPGDPQNENRGP